MLNQVAVPCNRLKTEPESEGDFLAATVSQRWQMALCVHGRFRYVFRPRLWAKSAHPV
jgi:hypothetical protein